MKRNIELANERDIERLRLNSYWEPQLCAG